MSSFLANFVSEKPHYTTERVMEIHQIHSLDGDLGIRRGVTAHIWIKTDGIYYKCKIIFLKQKIVMDQGCPI